MGQAAILIMNFILIHPEKFQQIQFAYQMDLKLYCHCLAFCTDYFCIAAPCLNRHFDCPYLPHCSHESPYNL